MREMLLYPLLSQNEQRRLLMSIKGIWKNRKPDPVKELKKIRQERERMLPTFLGRS